MRMKRQGTSAMLKIADLNRGGRGVRSPADVLVRDPDERWAETTYHPITRRQFDEAVDAKRPATNAELRVRLTALQPKYSDHSINKLGLEGSEVDDLWAEVGECFDTDDGSHPGIEVSRLSPAGVSAIYAMLRGRSRLYGDPPEFWSRTKEASVLVDSVPDGARLVAAGEAEAFHHCVEGVVAGGVELPVLGIFVWSDIVELDYRMGREWGPAQVKGFFELLRDCCVLDPGAVVIPADFEGPPYPDRFLQSWSAYKVAAGLTNG